MLQEIPYFLMFGLNLSFDNWAELLLPVQLTHNTAYSTTLQETPQSQLDYLQQTIETSQIAYEVASRILEERADKQAVASETLSFSSFKPGEQVLSHFPYTEADCLNPKLICPWRVPYPVQGPTSLVIFGVTKKGKPAEITVHLGWMKKHYVPLSPSAPDLNALDDFCLGITLPVPNLEGSLTKVMIGAFIMQGIDWHKRGVGAASLTNFQYHLKLERYLTQMGI